MPMTIKRANALYKKLLRQYGMKEGFNVDRHIKNAYLSVGNCGFEILRLYIPEDTIPEDTSSDVIIYVFTKFIQLDCAERFVGWTNTGEMVSSEEDAHKLISLNN